MHLLHWPQRLHWGSGWGGGTLPSDNASWATEPKTTQIAGFRRNEGGARAAAAVHSARLPGT